ncbi:hypothetical protein B0T24DRAFT_249156 [Lasiosphaeria ovina]|uniref:Uncharacterized protein n=1 Tax=Lasiosphaeria ovina TaxID=92902 RepID=A0AAE0N6Y8_9PEZI|nr:hypothetical protein B0T24DRAFT_249156 [Lasiosphaeria ovina]
MVKRHTTPGIRWSSATQLLVWPSLACLWESGRDPEFSNGYGRMWYIEEAGFSILEGRNTLVVWWHMSIGPPLGLSVLLASSYINTLAGKLGRGAEWPFFFPFCLRRPSGGGGGELLAALESPYFLECQLAGFCTQGQWPGGCVQLNNQNR